jgi:methionine sulfoxide reductase heme-binding subunit
VNCLNCGESTRAQARFCPNCGEVLRRDPAAAEAERPSPGSAPDPHATMVIGPADAQRIRGRGVSTDPPAATRLPTASEAGIVSVASAPTPTAEPRYRHHWYRPGWISLGVFVVVTAVAYAVSLPGLLPHKENTYWYTARATGFIAYGLLTISVALGLVVSTRWRAFTGPWLVAERLHPQFLLASGMVLSFHVVSLLFLSFPVSQALIPFTSKFDPPTITLGIIAMYLMIILLVSTYLIGRIGYRIWHRIHYAGLLAWFLALGHAAGTGNDAGSPWAVAFYVVGVIIVVAFLLAYLVTRVAALRRREVSAGTA